MKDLYVCNLLKVYGGLLTENQRETAKLYYDIDLTVSEIAEEGGVSRQSVNDTLTKVKLILENYEKHIGLVNKKNDIFALVKDPALKQQIEKILEG